MDFFHCLNFFRTHHDIFARGFQVSNERCSVRHSLEVLKSQIDPDGMSNSDQMQDSISGASEDHGQDLRGTPKSGQKV